MRSCRHHEELQILHELQIPYKELQIPQAATDTTRSYRYHEEQQMLNKELQIPQEEPSLKC